MALVGAVDDDLLPQPQLLPQLQLVAPQAQLGVERSAVTERACVSV
jgi:hypothetical protein